MSLASLSLQDASQSSPGKDFADPGRHSGDGGTRLIHPAGEDSSDRRPPRARLRRLLGLQMDAFVAEALADEQPRVLAGRIENIVQLSLELYSTSRPGAARRRDGGQLAGILRYLEAQRIALLACEQAPSGIRHALDPLLVAVLRGDLEAG